MKASVIYPSRFGLIATGLSMWVFTSTASAAEAGPSAGESDTTALQEVVVTAQKRQENLQKVPIAVSAISADTISTLHADTLQGLQGTVPSVQLSNYVNTPNVAAFFIRGMGTLEADPYAGQTVSIVVDGVPQYFTMGALLDTYDLDRVEVLRGPQGTLFGANTTGGVVNVMTRQPTGEFGGNLELTGGNYSRFDALGALDFPIIKDLLAGKIVFNHTQKDGYVTNVFNGKSMGDRDHDDVRAYLKFTPYEKFDATVIGEYNRGRDGSPIVISGAVPGEALYVAPGTVVPNSRLPMYQQPCTSLAARCTAPDHFYSANDSTADLSNIDVYSINLTMNLRGTLLGDITSISAYKHIRLLEQTDQDGTPIFLFDTNRKTNLWQFSQELRSSLQVTDALNVIYGAFYLTDAFQHLQQLRLPYAVQGLRQDNPQHETNHSISGFAQAYFDVTERLRLQAGVRYTYEETEMHAAIDRYSFPGDAEFTGGTFLPDASFAASGKDSWRNFGWKFGPDYALDDNRQLYAYWARGFKSGGFVGRLGIPQDIGPYRPEIVDTFEGGLKADWLDHRLRTNVAVFFNNYRDMQLATQYILNDANGDFIQGNTIQNVASAHTKGVEFDATVVPVRGLTLNASVAYLDARYVKFPFLNISSLGTETIDLSGYRLQNSPPWSGSAGFVYEFAAGPGKAKLGMQYNYTDKKFLTSQVDAPRSVIAPVSLVNANLDWTPNNGNWTIGLWGKNIFDHRYLANVYDFPGTLAFVTPAPPAEFGGTVRYRF
jgi:iron complex outermembrane receptor protein